MHLVVFQHGQLKQLWTPVTWAILVGAGYGLLRLVVDVVRAIGSYRRRGETVRPAVPADPPSGLIARERWKAARRRATVEETAPDDPDAPPFAWWSQR